MTESLNFLHQGESLLKQERWEEAAEAFRKSIERDTENAWPHHHLGDALARLGHLSEAIAAYEQALALSPKSPWTLINYGNVLSRLGRWEQAETAYRSAIGFDWTQPMAFLHLGEALGSQGYWEEAAYAYRTSISLDAGNAWPHHHLGDALCHLGDHAHAISAYEQALVLSPESFWTLRNLGRALTELGQWERAEEVYEKAVVLDSSQPQLFLQLGETLARQGNWEAAAQAYRSSIDLDAGNAWSHHLLGDALGRLEDYSSAVTAYETALSLSPESPWTLKNLGNALSHLERWHEAEAAYAAARLLLPDDLQLVQAQAGVWLKLERWQEAATAYEQCLVACPDDAQLQRNLGIAVFKLETQKAYLKANPSVTVLLPGQADAEVPLPELEWTQARFGSRVFEVERWLEGLIPGYTESPVDTEEDSEQPAESARMLFILDNDFGELTTVMYLLLGQKNAENIMVQLPQRLYQANSGAFPGRTFCYQSMDDLEQAVESFSPDIVFLCSGYLYRMHDICSHEALEIFVDALVERNCKVVTADPFLGVLSQAPISSLISIDVPDATDLELPAHVFAHLESVKKEQDEKIVEQLTGAERILRNHLHLYPAHAMPSAAGARESDAREIAFFNPNLLYEASLAPETGTKPHWLFILSATDLEGQLMFEAVHGFREIVVRLLQQAVEAGRRPVFIAPEKFIRELAREMRGYEDVELLSFCSFTRLVPLLLTAEYAFYWNSVSHTILLRSFNGLPVILFDRGHLVRNVEAIYERVVQWYYQGSEPIYMDHHQPLTLANLDAATAGFEQASVQMIRAYARAPEPAALVDQVLGATG